MKFGQFPQQVIRLCKFQIVLVLVVVDLRVNYDQVVVGREVLQTYNLRSVALGVLSTLLSGQIVKIDLFLREKHERIFLKCYY